MVKIPLPLKTPKKRHSVINEFTKKGCAYSTIQYYAIRYNTIQYNTIQYNTIQYNTIQYNTNTIQIQIQYNTIQYKYNKIHIQHNITQKSFMHHFQNAQSA